MSAPTDGQIIDAQIGFCQREDIAGTELVGDAVAYGFREGYRAGLSAAQPPREPMKPRGADPSLPMAADVRGILADEPAAPYALLARLTMLRTAIAGWTVNGEPAAGIVNDVIDALAARDRELNKLEAASGMLRGTTLAPAPKPAAPDGLVGDCQRWHEKQYNLRRPTRRRAALGEKL